MILDQHFRGRARIQSLRGRGVVAGINLDANHPSKPAQSAPILGTAVNKSIASQGPAKGGERFLARTKAFSSETSEAGLPSKMKSVALVYPPYSTVHTKPDMSSVRRI